jgi:hypothetical protein
MALSLLRAATTFRDTITGRFSADLCERYGKAKRGATMANRYAATDQAVADAPQTYRVLMRSFQHHLRAENKAVRTVQTYTARPPRLPAAHSRPALSET